MFFNALVLTKKGPLGKIWLAAHYRKKLSKKDIIKVNVSESVEAILESRILLSLRTSSHLLYGISYLFNKQVSYLLSDALEYAYCVPQFITGRGIDLDEQLESINEVNLNVDSDLSFNLTQDDAPELKMTNLGQIKLQGEAAEIICDEFEDVDILRHDSRDSIHVEEILFEDHVFLDDGFGGSLDQDPTTIFDLHDEAKTQSTVDVPDELQHHEDAPIIDFFDLPSQPDPKIDEVQVDMDQIPRPKNVHVSDPMASPKAGPSGWVPSMEEARQPSTSGVSRNVALEDELILEPLDESYRRPKRQRIGKLIIDEINEIDRDTIKTNIRDAQEPEIELAPATRNLMIAKKTLRAEALLKTPDKCFSSFQLKLFQSHLQVISEIVDRDDDSTIIGEENINEGRSMDIPEFGNNFDQDVPMEDLPPLSVIPEDPEEAEIAQIPEKEVNKERKQLKPDEPEIQSSQEKGGSQRRKKRQKLSQEQARRGTVHEPELLHHDSDVEFERTQMPGDPIPDNSDFLFDSQSHSEYQPTPDDGLLSQLSQTLNEPVSFSQLTQDYNRKKAALTFFQLLVLHKQSVIILDQEKFYEEIWIAKGPNFRGTLHTV